MYIDYVRIYQKEGEESITCDPRKQCIDHVEFGLILSQLDITPRNTSASTPERTILSILRYVVSSFFGVGLTGL